MLYLSTSYQEPSCNMCRPGTTSLPPNESHAAVKPRRLVRGRSETNRKIKEDNRWDASPPRQAATLAVAPQMPRKIIPKSNKSVRFNDVVNCRLTTHHFDYSDNERTMYWRTEEDAEEALHEILEIIDDLNTADKKRIASSTIDEVNTSRRGLEFVTDHGKVLRQKNRLQANGIVLEGQLRSADLSQEGIDADEAIAKYYGKASRHSMMAAYLLGKIDEQQVTEDTSCALLPASTFQELLQQAREKK